MTHVHDDARVHRCQDCGAWCYSRRPCTTCAIANRIEDAA